MATDMVINVKLKGDKESIESLNKLKLKADEIKKRMASGLLNSAQMKKSKTELRALNTEMIKLGTTTKKGTSSMKKFGLMMVGGLGITALIGGLTRVVKNAYNIIKRFDQAIGNLAAVTGKSKEELKELTDSAKALELQTKFTATEVVGLQLEFAKLGFSTDEILSVQEASLKLAQAWDIDLSRTATLVGGTIRGFGLDISETDKVLNLLAKSTSISALNVSKLETTLGIVAPVSKVAGVSIEKTVAILGTLSNANIDASTSATSLRNIFLELAGNGMTWDEAMDKISNSTDSLSVAYDLFGKRGATAAIVLASNKKETDELNESLKDVSGTLDEMSEKQLDTIEGQATLMKSAWSGFIKSISGDGASTLLKDIFSGITSSLNDLSENMEKIIKNIKLFFKIIFIGVSSIKAYTLALKFLTISINIFSIRTKVAAISTKVFSIATNVATIATKMFNAALKLNPIGIVISLLVAAASAFLVFRDNTKEATVEQTNFNDELKETERIINSKKIIKFLTDAGLLKKKIIDLGEGNFIEVDEIDTSVESLNKLQLAISTLSISELKGLSNIISDEVVELKRELYDAKKAIETGNLDEIFKFDINDIEDKLTSLKQSFKEINKVISFSEDSDGDEMLEKKIKEAEKTAKALRGIRIKTLELNKISLEDELEILDKKLENDKINARQTIDNLEVRNAKLKFLDDKYKQDQLDTIQKFEDDILKKKVKQREKADKALREIEIKTLELTKMSLEDELDILDKKLENDKINTEQTINNLEVRNAKLKFLDDKYKQDQLDIIQKFKDKKTKKEEEEYRDNENEFEKHLDELNNILRNSLLDEDFDIWNIYKIKDNSDEMIENVKDVYTELIRLKKLNNEDITELEKEGYSLIQSIKDDADDIEREKIIEKTQFLLDQISAQVLFITDVIGSSAQNRIDRLNNYQTEELKKLEELNKNKIINDEEYNKRKEELEGETLKKINKEKTKQAKAEKANSLFQIAINTAVAISKIWSETGLAAILLQALPIAMGAIQFGLVASKPIPKFAGGGRFDGLVNGPSHASGGISTPYGEIEGREFIVNKTQTDRNLPLLQAINSSNEDVISEMNKRLDILISLNAQPMRSYVVESDITESQKTIKNIEQNATI